MVRGRVRSVAQLYQNKNFKKKSVNGDGTP